MAATAVTTATTTALAAQPDFSTDSIGDVDQVVRTYLRRIIQVGYVKESHLAPTLFFEGIDRRDLIKLVKQNHGLLVVKHWQTCRRRTQPPHLPIEGVADINLRALLHNPHSAGIEIDPKMYFEVAWWFFCGLSNASVNELLKELTLLTERCLSLNKYHELFKEQIEWRLFQDPRGNRTMRQFAALQLTQLTQEVSAPTRAYLLKLAQRLVRTRSEDRPENTKDIALLARIREQRLQICLNKNDLKTAYAQLDKTYKALGKAQGKPGYAVFERHFESGVKQLIWRMLEEENIAGIQQVWIWFACRDEFWLNVVEEGNDLQLVIQSIQLLEDKQRVKEILLFLLDWGYGSQPIIAALRAYKLSDLEKQRVAVYRDSYSAFARCRGGKMSVEALQNSLPSEGREKLFLSWSKLLIHAGEPQLALQLIEKTHFPDRLLLMVELREKSAIPAAASAPNLPISTDIIQMLDEAIGGSRANYRHLLERCHAFSSDQIDGNRDWVDRFAAVFGALLLAEHYTEARDLFEEVHLLESERRGGLFRQKIVEAAYFCRELQRLDWLLGWAVELSIGPREAEEDVAWISHMRENWPQCAVPPLFDSIQLGEPQTETRPVASDLPPERAVAKHFDNIRTLLARPEEEEMWDYLRNQLRPAFEAFEQTTDDPVPLLSVWAKTYMFDRAHRVARLIADWLSSRPDQHHRLLLELKAIYLYQAKSVKE